MVWLRCLLLVCLVAGISPQDLPPVPPDLAAALAALPVQPMVVDGQRVVVTRDGAPVAGADVYVIDGARAREGQAALRRVGQTSELSQVRSLALSACWWGTRYQTDADGVALVAAQDGDRVHVRTRDAVGTASRAGQPGVARTVALEPLREVRVRVLDARGRPAVGVPVRLAWRGGSSLRQADRQATGAEGRALLFATGAAQLDALVAWVDCLGAAPEFATVGDAPELVLTAPPMGMLRVIAYDEQERPRSGVREVSLDVVANPVRGGRNFEERTWSAPKLERDGAMFRCVALGKQFTARVRFDGVAGEQSVSGDGPKLPNELVVLTLREKLGDPSLKLRVLDLTGAPCAKQRLALVRAWHAGYSLLGVEADAQGQLDVTLPADWRAAEGQRLLVVARAPHDPANRATGYRGAVDVTALALQPATSARHAVQLREEPVLLAGRVLDAEGKPVAGATVTVDYSWTVQPGPISFRGTADVRLQHDAVSDAEGRFEFRELVPRDVLLPVRVSASGWVAAGEVRAAPGKTDVEVRVALPGSLTLKLPGAPKGAMLYAYLECDGQTRGVHQVGDDGCVTFAALPPGKWNLKFRMGLEALDTLGLEVPPGGACADPRLVRADWRDKVLLVDTKVRSPQGQPLDVSVNIMTEHPGGSSSMGTSVSGGRVLILASREVTRITLSHAEHRSVELDPKATPAEVTMQPRALAVLRLPQGLALPAGLPVMVIPQRGGPGGEQLLWPDGDRLELSLASLEPASVVLMVPREVRPGVMSGQSVWQGKLEFRDGVAKQEVTLDISKEDVERIRELWADAKGEGAKSDGAERAKR